MNVSTHSRIRVMDIVSEKIAGTAFIGAEFDPQTGALTLHSEDSSVSTVLSTTELSDAKACRLVVEYLVGDSPLTNDPAPSRQFVPSLSV